MRLFTDDEQMFERLTAYCLGELSAADKRAVEEWVAADVAHRKQLQQVQKLLRETDWQDTPSAEISVDHAWQQVKAGIDKQDTEKMHDLRGQWYQVAAAAAVLLVCCWAIYFRNDLPPTQWIALTGHTDTLRLPDGSIVVATKGTHVYYDRRFNIDNRNVKLEGTATFDVSQQAGKPFHIQTTLAGITVLGTRFTVNSKADSFSVKVSDGAIKAGLNTEKKTVLLRRGEMAWYNRAEKQLHKDNFADSMMLRYHNTPLATIAKELLLAKQIELTGDTTIMATRLTVDFRQSSIGEIRQALTLLTGRKVEVSGRRILIR